MKRLVLVILFFGMGYAYAQVEQGDVSAAFNISYLSIDGNGTAIISAKAGYYINNNIELGATPTIILGSGFSSTSIGAYGTYNFLTSDAKLLPYAGGSLGLVVQSYQGPFDDETYVEANPTYGLYAGSKYFMNEKFFADANMNISGSGIGTIFSINLGIGFLVGRLR